MANLVDEAIKIADLETAVFDPSFPFIDSKTRRKQTIQKAIAEHNARPCKLELRHSVRSDISQDCPYFHKGIDCVHPCTYCNKKHRCLICFGSMVEHPTANVHCPYKQTFIYCLSPFDKEYKVLVNHLVQDRDEFKPFSTPFPSCNHEINSYKTAWEKNQRRPVSVEEHRLWWEGVIVAGSNAEALEIVKGWDPRSLDPSIEVYLSDPDGYLEAYDDSAEVAAGDIVPSYVGAGRDERDQMSQRNVERYLRTPFGEDSPPRDDNTFCWTGHTPTTSREASASSSPPPVSNTGINNSQSNSHGELESNVFVEQVVEGEQHENAKHDSEDDEGQLVELENEDGEEQVVELESEDGEEQVVELESEDGEEQLVESANEEGERQLVQQESEEQVPSEGEKNEDGESSWDGISDGEQEPENDQSEDPEPSSGGTPNAEHSGCPYCPEPDTDYDMVACTNRHPGENGKSKEVWVHYECVTREALNRIEHWYCPDCKVHGYKDVLKPDNGDDKGNDKGPKKGKDKDDKGDGKGSGKGNAKGGRKSNGKGNGKGDDKGDGKGDGKGVKKGGKKDDGLDKKEDKKVDGLDEDGDSTMSNTDDVETASNGEEPEAKKKSSNRGALTKWDTSQEHLVGEIMRRNLTANDPEFQTEKKWAIIADELRTVHGVDRTASSIKNYWNRKGRKESRLDERKKKKPDRLVTGARVAKSKK